MLFKRFSIDRKEKDVKPGENFIGYLNLVAGAVKTSFSTVMRRNQPERPEIHKVFPDNYSLTFIRTMAKQGGFGTSAIYLKNIAKFGHAFTSDNLIKMALIRMKEDKMDTLNDQLYRQEAANYNEVNC